MAYKCLNCKKLFDNVKICSEPIGEYEGQIAYQDYMYCPHCHSDEIEETKTCLICGEEYTDDELNNGICKDCIEDASHDTELCSRIYEGITNDTNYSKLINEDIDWFIQELAEIYEEK